MSPSADLTDDSEVHAPPDGTAAEVPSSAAPGLLGRIPRLGVWSWSFVGLVVASIIVFVALAAVSEIVLPMTFAAVLAVVFKPLIGTLHRNGLKPSLAAGLVVLGLLALVAGIAVATVRGVVDQADQIGTTATAALENAADETDALGIDEEALEDARTAIEDAAPMITTGVLSGLISGIGALVGIASGLMLGALIMYYSARTPTMPSNATSMGDRQRGRTPTVVIAHVINTFCRL
jgi:predicted PurR-regulated permease PerM